MLEKMSKYLPLKLLFCFLTLTAAAALAAEMDVLQLNDADFADTLRAHETTLVMFYAPWCGHCQRLTPEYARAAELVWYDDPPIALAMVDCTAGGKQTCEAYGVQTYPTLKIFHRDQIAGDYHGSRHADDIASFMRTQVHGGATKERRYLDEIQQLLDYIRELEAPQPQTFLRSPDDMQRLDCKGDAPHESSERRNTFERSILQLFALIAAPHNDDDDADADDRQHQAASDWRQRLQKADKHILDFALKLQRYFGREKSYGKGDAEQPVKVDARDVKNFFEHSFRDFVALLVDGALQPGCNSGKTIAATVGHENVFVGHNNSNKDAFYTRWCGKQLTPNEAREIAKNFVCCPPKAARHEVDNILALIGEPATPAQGKTEL